MLPTNPLLNATAPAGPHLPVALLRQYAAGTLAPAAQHRVEAHTLGCPRCADILEGLLQTPPATTDQAVAQLQQRLRQRVQQVGAPGRQGPRLAPRPRWLSLQLAAAATLLLSLVAGGWWAWQQRRLGASTAAVAAASSPTKPAALATRPLSPLTPPTVAKAPTAVPFLPPLARASAKRLSRHMTKPTTASRQIAPITALPVAPATVPAVSAPAPTVVASQLPATASDSLGVALATKPVARQSFAVEPAPVRVRVGRMPAAGGLAPTPPGGMATFREKLRREAAEFVPEAPERPLSGTVQLRLTIDATGKLTGSSVIRGLRADYDAEAQRLVCDGPAWVPGISEGRRATLQVDVAVPF